MDLNLSRTFIVAEIGNNHEGNFSIAKKLIFQAAKAGVDAVKFQTFIPENYYDKNFTDRIKFLKSINLKRKQIVKLKNFAKKNKLLFFSTPFDVKSAEFLNRIQPIFKISSGDNNFLELIKKIATFKKPIIISTGGSDFGEILKIRKIVKSIWSKKKYKQKLIFLHCITEYPTKSSDANLSTIYKLKKMFPKEIIGYSDHTKGINVSVTAVACGAKVIEKHFTLDKNFSNFRDHKISANPKELKQLVKKIRKTELILGNERIGIFEN